MEKKIVDLTLVYSYMNNNVLVTLAVVMALDLCGIFKYMAVLIHT